MNLRPDELRAVVFATRVLVTVTQVLEGVAGGSSPSTSGEQLGDDHARPSLSDPELASNSCALSRRAGACTDATDQPTIDRRDTIAAVHPAVPKCLREGSSEVGRLAAHDGVRNGGKAVQLEGTELWLPPQQPSSPQEQTVQRRSCQQARPDGPQRLSRPEERGVWSDPAGIRTRVCAVRGHRPDH